MNHIHRYTVRTAAVIYPTIITLHIQISRLAKSLQGVLLQCCTFAHSCFWGFFCMLLLADCYSSNFQYVAIITTWSIWWQANLCVQCWSCWFLTGKSEIPNFCL